MFAISIFIIIVSTWKVSYAYVCFTLVFVGAIEQKQLLVHHQMFTEGNYII